MTGPAHTSGSFGIDNVPDETIITEAVRRGLIAPRLDQWDPLARRVLAELESTNWQLRFETPVGPGRRVAC